MTSTAGPNSPADDLVSRMPAIDFRNLATDGATIGDVFGEQMSQLDETDEPTLVTLTVGGNDLLSAYGSRARRSLLEPHRERHRRRVRFSARHAAHEAPRRNVRHRDRLRSLRPQRPDSRRVRRRRPASARDPRPIQRARSHARRRNAAHSSGRRARPLPRPRRERRRIRPMVLASLAHRAEREGGDQVRSRLARGAPRGWGDRITAVSASASLDGVRPVCRPSGLRLCLCSPRQLAVAREDIRRCCSMISGSRGRNRPKRIERAQTGKPILACAVFDRRACGTRAAVVKRDPRPARLSRRAAAQTIE